MKDCQQPVPRLRSLRARFSLILGGFSLLLALLISGIVGEFSERRERQTIALTLERTADEMTVRFAAALKRRAGAVAALENQLHSANNPEAQHAVLADSFLSYADRTWMGFADLSGIVRVSTDSASEGVNVKGTPAFEGALKGPFLQSLPAGANEGILEMSRLVLDDNRKPEGILIVRFDWDWLRRLSESVVTPLRARSQIQILLIDHHGHVLSAPGRPGLESSSPPLLILPNVDDGDFLSAAAGTPEDSAEFQSTGWIVLAQQPKVIALLPVQGLRYEVMAWGLACGIFFALVGWFVSTRAVRPLAAIAEAAREITRGENRRVLPVANDDVEIVMLVNALNGLLETRDEQAEALRQSAARLRLATEAAGVGIWTWDLASGRVNCTPECSAIFGREDESLTTSGAFFRLVHRDDRRRIWQAVKSSLSEKKAYDCEFRFIRPDGAVRWAVSRGRGEYDAKGKAVRLLGVVSDITSRKEAERAIAEQARLLDISCDAILVRDANARIVYWNRSAENVYGWTSTEAIGQRSHDFLKTGFPIPLEEIEAALRMEGRWEGELKHTRRDGAILTVMTRWVLDRDATGKTVAVMESNTDITDHKRAELALRESEERNRSLFENNIDGIFSLDLNGFFIDANPAALHLSDYTLEELRHMQFMELCAPDKLEQALEVFKQVAAGATVPIETALINRHGKRVELIVHGTPIITHGKLVGIYGVVADITEKKRVEEALRDREQMLSVAIDAAQMGTWDWDLETNEIRFSERTRQIFWNAPDERLTLESFYARMHPDDRKEAAASIQRAVDGPGDYETQYRLIGPGGEVRWVSAIGRSLPNSPQDHKRLVGVVFDVTPAVMAAHDLSVAKEEAEAASRAKDDFLAALSHELRTPLNPVLMLASELADSPDLSPRVKGDFAMIRKNVALEARLIDDLLDLTRITRGKLLLQLQHADIHTLLYQSFELLRADAENKQLVISFDLSAPERVVNGDPVRLQQVFWNVIKNAVKFTPPGGSITMRSREGSGHTVVIEIADSGMGMDPEELPRIFDAFAQGAQSGPHRFGGLGLGLSISKLLVQLHHGRIDATSDGLGQGSSFRIELPLADHELIEPPAPSPPEALPMAHALRILLIEDHEPTRTTLSRLLTKRGHKVSAAETVATARALAAATEFDFVISDIGLPDGNGQDLMVELRQSYGLIGIALSGYGREEDIRRSLESGFVAHLVKPIDIQALEAAMLSAMKEVKDQQLQVPSFIDPSS